MCELDFDKDLVTKAIIVSNNVWNQFLAIKSNKKNFDKFRYKSLANEKTLRILFFDLLTIEANVTISLKIVTKELDFIKDVDIDNKFKEKKKSYTNIATILNREQTKLNRKTTINKTKQNKIFVLLTSKTSLNFLIFTFFFVFFLKRLVANQNTFAQKRKQITSKLFVQTIKDLNRKIDNIVIKIIAKTKCKVATISLSKAA